MATAEQKLLELKKAYADVILNTTKEAAARVLAADKKAKRFQYELDSSKKEAVRLLVRQKQIMDAKINEAEMKALSQQKRIDELEDQLHEAEDIVRDLRAELRQTKSALEKIAYKQLYHSNEQISKPVACVQEETSQEDKVNNTSQPVNMNNSTVNQNNEEYKNPHTENHLICNPDFPFPSILMRNKEPELYRNRCTQRIRAFERKLMDIKSTLSGHTDDLKNETGIKGKEAEDNVCAIEKREEDGSCDLMQGVKPIFLKRKRAARCRKSSFHDASKLAFSETLPGAVDNNVHSGETTFVTDDDEAQNDMKSGCDTDDETNTMFIKPCSVQRISTLARHEGGPSESSETVCESDDVSLAKSNLEITAAIDLVHSQLGNDKFLKYTFTRKRKKGSLSNQDNESLEESTSKQKTGERPNDHEEPEEPSSNGLKQMTGEDQIGSADPRGPSLRVESSRDSRRIAVVAHQLVSLSEKKW